ncbi:MAG: SDR family oxidoreductase [Flavobacteriales bacterium]|nr:SDR family oxidoreductase [Flavobacteriales bacterium]
MSRPTWLERMRNYMDGTPHETTGLVVVTGAGRGVGRALVKDLVERHGRQVLAISRDPVALDRLVQACSAGPGSVEVLALDLAEPTASGKVRDVVGTRRVIALINNAGILIKRSFGDWSMQDADELFRVNAAVPFLLAQALVDRLDGDPMGHVVNVGSMGGFQDSAKFPSLLAYSASKAAMACVSQCLAEEFKDRGIRSNCLAIGAVDTEMLRAAFPEHKAPIGPEAMARYISRFALEGHNLYNGKVLPLALSTP